MKTAVRNAVFTRRNSIGVGTCGLLKVDLKTSNCTIPIFAEIYIMAVRNLKPWDSPRNPHSCD